MADKIRMNYAAVDEMRAQCQQLANKMLASAESAKSQAAKMQEGALIGTPGDTFVQALNQMQKSTTKLHLKLTEIVRDIEQAMADIQRADSGTKF